MNGADVNDFAKFAMIFGLRAKKIIRHHDE